MKLGAEPKRLAALGLLIAVAGYLLYSNVFSDQSPAPSGGAAPAPRTLVADRTGSLPEPPGPVPRAEARPTTQSLLQEFKPSLKAKRAGIQGDLSSVDATMRMDLLAKLEAVRIQGGSRSLFEFSAAPQPPEAKVIPKPKVQTVPLPPPPPPPPPPPQKPVAPPIPLKFFGYTTASKQGNRRAFFMDGDQILVASEGEVVKKRYRVVRIGVNSVVMEDLEFKSEQTLPLEPQV